MAELNQRLQNLGMNDSVHADAPSSGTSNHSSGSGEKRAAYIPPHMRHAMRAPPAAAAPVAGPPPVQNGSSNGVQASRWSPEYVHDSSFFPFFCLSLPLFRVVFLSHLEIILVMRQTYKFCHVTIGPLKKRF